MSSYDLNAVLEWINIGREALEMEPLTVIPAGERYSPVTCPVARALERRVSGTVWARDPAEAFNLGQVYGHLREVGNVTTTGFSMCTVALPPLLTSFIAAFDRGEHPELEQPRE